MFCSILPLPSSCQPLGGAVSQQGAHGAGQHLLEQLHVFVQGAVSFLNSLLQCVEVDVVPAGDLYKCL